MNQSDSFDIAVGQVPIGGIIGWLGNTDKIPDNYIVLNGQKYKFTNYPGLYPIINQVLNDGDGLFTTPNDTPPFGGVWIMRVK